MFIMSFNVVILEKTIVTKLFARAENRERIEKGWDRKRLTNGYDQIEKR